MYLPACFAHLVGPGGLLEPAVQPDRERLREGSAVWHRKRGRVGEAREVGGATGKTGRTGKGG